MSFSCPRCTCVQAGALIGDRIECVCGHVFFAGMVESGFDDPESKFPNIEQQLPILAKHLPIKDNTYVPSAAEEEVSVDDEIHALNEHERKRKEASGDYVPKAALRSDQVHPLPESVLTDSKIFGNPTPRDYDHSIHSNADAVAWANFFINTLAALAKEKGGNVLEEVGKSAMDQGYMISWFANAMCAQMDFDERRRRLAEIARKGADNLKRCGFVILGALGCILGQIIFRWFGNS